MARFDAARHVLEQAIAERAFPGAIVEIGTDRDVLWRFAAGTLSYDDDSPPVRDDNIYDLASLTQVMATASLVLREIHRGSLALDDTLPYLLPGCRNPALAAITVEDLLSHAAGFPDYRPFYQTLEGEDAFEAGICATPLEFVPRTQSICVVSRKTPSGGRHWYRPRQPAPRRILLPATSSNRCSGNKTAPRPSIDSLRAETSPTYAAFWDCSACGRATVYASSAAAPDISCGR